MHARRLMPMLGLAAGLLLFGVASPVRAVDSDGDGVDDAFDVCSNTPSGTPVDAEGRPLGDVDLDCDTDLVDFALFQQGSANLLGFGLVQRGFTGPLPLVIDTVPIGNPGNSNDTHGDGYGAVDYTYNIGTYEVTAWQYTNFLNAVAKSDPYGLYNSFMESSSDGCQITRNGSGGNYIYDYSGRPSGIGADWASRPVNYVSWGDAARFANWMHNGLPTGAQDLTTTEDGSYLLNGARTEAELQAVTREPDATWVVPSEDEWYKAAYHHNDGATSNYWDYPTSSDNAPSNDLIDPDPWNNATFNDGGYTIDSPYYRTNIGAHENSDSPYGTFDQGGNVWEWIETRRFGSFRGVRGGSFVNSDFTLHAENRFYFVRPASAGDTIGFRVVSKNPTAQH